MRKIAKYVATLGTGIVMLGATVTSAVALDLADYPAPYLMNGKYDTSNLIVIGEDAKPIDTLGAISISNDWQVNSYIAGGSGGTTVSITDGEFEKVPINDRTADTQIADNSYIDNELDDSDLSWLADSTLNFQSEDYDYREVIFISQVSPSLETSLTSSDDDYETSVVMEIKKKSLGYYIIWDESITITNATTSDPLEIDFLGRRLKITNAVDAGNKFTAQVGEEHFMKAGDTVEVEGKRVTLQNVGSGGAIIIDVDGEIETISSGSTETVNGIEINNDETFYDSNDISQRSASLVIGKDAVATYKDNDAFIGEDKNDPDWVWDIKNLHIKGSTVVVSNQTGITPQSGPTLGILNDFVVNSDNDKGIVASWEGAASCYSFPGNYVQICLDSLTLNDDDYMRLTMEIVDDLSIADAADQNALFIEVDETEGLVVDASALDNPSTGITTDKKTDKIWLIDRDANTLNVYYWDTTDLNETFAGYINLTDTTSDVTTGSTTDGIFAFINWGDTKSDSATDGQQGILLRAYNTSGTGAVSILLDVGRDDTNGPDRISTSSGPSQDVINITWQDGNGADFTRLGSTKDKEQAEELLWNNTNIGTKDEDHMSIYGIIIRDPKSNGASDTVVLDIPRDQLYGNIVVRGSSTVIAAGVGNRITVPIEVDTTTTSDKVSASQASTFNLILVGGPVVNPLVTSVFGIAADGWELGAGEGLIKLIQNGDKVAMLVAGTTGEDTLLASKVLANSEDYTNFKGTEVVVKGTSLSNVQLSAAA